MSDIRDDSTGDLGPFGPEVVKQGSKYFKWKLGCKSCLPPPPLQKNATAPKIPTFSKI